MAGDPGTERLLNLIKELTYCARDLAGYTRVPSKWLSVVKKDTRGRDALYAELAAATGIFVEGTASQRGRTVNFFCGWGVVYNTPGAKEKHFIICITKTKLVTEILYRDITNNPDRTLIELKIARMAYITKESFS